MLWFVLLFNVVVWLTQGYFQKYLSHTIKPIFLTVVMFAVAEVTALVLHFYTWHTIVLHKFGWIIMGMGAMNAVAAWFFIHGVRIHLSKTSIVSPLTTLVSMLMSIIFLKEWRLIDPRTIGGLMLGVGSTLGVIAMMLFGTDSANDRAEKKDQKKWLLFVATAILIWGFINFMIKMLTIKEVPMTIFLLYWYTGALASILFIVCMLTIFQRGAREPMATQKNTAPLWMYVALGLLTFTSLGSFYWLISLGPGILIFPAHDVLTIGGSVVMGLWVFKEKERMRKRDWIGISIGALGILLLLGSSILRS